MNRRKILIIEDENDIAELLKLHLVDLCDDVVISHTGEDGLRKARANEWSLIILDLRLPGIDGLEVCRLIRADSAYVPILMLTSKSSELDRVLGLEIGADDYMVKPFSILELIARVKAIFRRVRSLQEQQTTRANGKIEVGNLSIDIEKRCVLIDTHSVELTAKEFDLLLHFVRHPGKVFRRIELLDHVWGYGHDGYEHTVNSHINRLRAKIENDPNHPQYIMTVWGVGYKFADISGQES